MGGSYDGRSGRSEEGRQLPALLESRFGTAVYCSLNDQAPKPCVVTYMTRLR